MTTLNDFKYSLLTDQDKTEIDKHNKTTRTQHQQSTSQQHVSHTETDQDNYFYNFCGFSSLFSKLKNCLGIDNAFTFF